MANILLTGGRAPVALALARSLHAAGHKVFMAESAPGHLSQPSRALETNYLVPPPRQQSAAFIHAIRNIVLQNKIDLLIPTCEEVFFIGAGRNELPCQVFAESIDKLRKLHNKWSFAKYASDLGLRVPETVLIGTADELRLAFAERRELVLKPVYSRFAARTLVAPSFDEAASRISFDAGRPWIAQEFIHGNQICTYSVVHRGRLTAHTAYRAEFTAGLGATVVFQHIDHPGILDWVQRFAASVGFTGQIAFDFIETMNGEIYALECNPRATSGLHLLCSEPGFSAAFLDETASLFTPCSRRSVMLATGMLVYGLKDALKKRRFRRWLSTFLSSEDVVFDARDPLPFLLQGRSILHYVGLAMKHKISVLAASTYDIEWNGEEIGIAEVPEQGGGAPS